MKKFARFTLLCFIPVVAGVVCLIVGNTTGNSTVTYAGMLSLIAGLPAMMIIFLIVGLILMSTGKLGDGKKPESDTTDTTDTTDAADNKTTITDVAREEETPSQREREQNAIDKVNGSSRYESRVNMSEYEIQHVAEGMKNAPKWGVAVGLTSFFLLVADIIAATVLLINRIFIGAIVCAALFGVVIITAFTVVAVSRAKALNGDISKAKKITEGKVKTCYMVGTATTRTDGNCYQSSNGQTVRVSGVTYRVIVSADGEEYAAFSKQFYETGETVTIAVTGIKRAKIVDEAELEKLNNSDTPSS